MKRVLRFSRFMLMLTILFTLAACSEEEKSNNKPYKKQVEEQIVYSFEHPETKQKFKVVQAYKLYTSLIEQLEKNHEAAGEVYQNIIIDKVYNACFKDGEYLHMVDNLLNWSPENPDSIKKILKEIDEEKTNAAIMEALLKSSDFLPSEEETAVCVFPSHPGNENTMVAAGAGKIIVFYNEFYTEDMIRAGIAHEYHHSIWTEQHLEKYISFSVLDNLIFEGKAVMFEKLVYPNITFSQVDPSFNKTFWAKVEGDLDTYDLNRSLEILMGGGQALPRHYGYSEGYKMVDSYLKLHPDTTPEEWTALSAEEIFQEGQYLKNYQ
ncbi:DUF2268 domain-containing putative Zn-dependent protease [Cytobacillus oceanisediminis]|uniref:DUF2268 domain-containing putative Zn-dependent protease n=1 Tax=Cytobacillus oceanisediminis TaxID=665099 RepID=UPI0024955591|nr:DUF2268 domain-containing putative Zn-dependent protease [Cytobacillus oceanisediminis]